MNATFRVLVWYRCPHDELDDFVAAFHMIGAQLAGVPGLLGNELLQAHCEEGSLVVMSEWESADAFMTWEAGHKPTTAALRPYLDTTRAYPFELYQIPARLPVNRPAPCPYCASSPVGGLRG